MIYANPNKRKAWMSTLTLHNTSFGVKNIIWIKHSNESVGLSRKQTNAKYLCS